MLKSKYLELVPKLQTELGMKSVSAVPRIQKTVISVGLGRALTDPKIIELVTDELTRISGQKPMVTKAKKSIAGFKLREGQPIGVTVTLRGDRMYDFLDKLINVALPRVRDFQGLANKGFDGRGNYNLGMTEHVVFPEIVFENVDKNFSLQITVVTTATNDDQARSLLQQLGFPFKKDK